MTPSLPGIFFVLFEVAFMIGLISLGSIQTVGVSFKQNATIHGYSYQEKFSVESYHGVSFIAILPSGAISREVTLTQSDLFGDKLTEEYFIANGTLLSLGTGRYEVTLSFDMANQSEPFSTLPVQLASKDTYPVSPYSWFVLSIPLSLISAALVLQARFRDRILPHARDFKGLITIAAEIDKEIELYQRSLDDIAERFNFHDGPKTEGLHSVKAVDDYLEKMPKQNRRKETRAGLLLLAFRNLLSSMEPQSRKLKPSWAFSLLQASYSLLITSVYIPKLTAFVARRKDLPGIGRSDAKLGIISNELTNETTGRKGTKIVYATFILGLFTALFSFPPTDFLVVKLPLLMYTLTNGIAFLFSWVAYS